MRKITELADSFYRKLFENGVEGVSLPLSLPITRENESMNYETVFTPSKTECEACCFFETDKLSGDFEVIVNGNTVGKFNSMYAEVYADISAFLLPDVENRLELNVEPKLNSEKCFTFGNARLIFVPESHFALPVRGGKCTQIKTLVHLPKAQITVDSEIVNPNNYDITVYHLYDYKGRLLETKTAKPTAAVVTFLQDAPKLWDGPHAPFVYRVECDLMRDGVCLDSEMYHFGIRSFEITKESFFTLNGIKSPVNGVELTDYSQVEDDIENALTLGVGTLKITGFSVYDDLLTKCDEAGLTVWLDLPYEHIEPYTDEIARIAFCASLHPCVAFLSATTENEEDAKAFCKTVKDNSRCVFPALFLNTLTKESIIDAVPDVIAVTIPGSATLDELTELGKNFSDICQRHPAYRFAVFAESPVCLFDRHSDNPVKNDCSQEYFSKWHETLWGVFCSQKEAVCYFAGQLTDGEEIADRKGLMTLDREEKKDIFWFYRAQFGAQDFIRLCSGSLTCVTDRIIDVKCYTGEKPVSISINGKIDTLQTPRKLSDCVYVFKNIKLKHGNNYIVVRSKEDTDSMVIFRSKSRLAKK